MKSFHSNKAQALVDTESSQEDIERTSHGAKEFSVVKVRSNTIAPIQRSPIIDSRLLAEPTDNRLFQSNRNTHFSNNPLLAPSGSPIHAIAPNFGDEEGRQSDASVSLQEVLAENLEVQGAFQNSVTGAPVRGENNVF